MKASRKSQSQDRYPSFEGIRITRLLQPGDGNTKLRKNGPEYLTAGLSLARGEGWVRAVGRMSVRNRLRAPVRYRNSILLGGGAAFCLLRNSDSVSVVHFMIAVSLMKRSILPTSKLAQRALR